MNIPSCKRHGKGNGCIRTEAFVKICEWLPSVNSEAKILAIGMERSCTYSMLRHEA